MKILTQENKCNFIYRISKYLLNAHHVLSPGLQRWNTVLRTSVAETYSLVDEADQGTNNYNVLNTNRDTYGFSLHKRWGLPKSKQRVGEILLE